MELIEKINGDLDNMEFTVDLSGYGKTFINVQDVTWWVKKEKTDTDANAIMLKKMSVGSIEMDVVDNGGTKLDVAVKWVIADFPNFNIKTKYLAGLFVKWVGQTTSDEKVDKLFEIRINQDSLEN